MCGAQTRWPGAASAAASTCSASASDVATGFSTSTCLPASSAVAREPAVLGHAREHEHDVDVGVPADRDVVGQVGAEVEPLGGHAALAGIGVVDRRHLDAALAAQPLDQAHVRRPEDAAAADDAEPDAHVALRAVS